MGDSTMNPIIKTVFQKDWEALILNYRVKDVCSALNFDEVMRVVKHLFYDDIQDDTKQQYALNLAFEVKEQFKKDWEADWKNDVFLGDLCEMLWRYDDRYVCYKRAYDKLQDPPAELLLLLSNCNSSPGKPPITKEESELYLEKALKKKVTCESALRMRSLYRQKKDKLQEEYWDQMYQKLEKEKVYLDQLIPDVFK